MFNKWNIQGGKLEESRVESTKTTLRNINSKWSVNKKQIKSLCTLGFLDFKWMLPNYSVHVSYMMN